MRVVLLGDSHLARVRRAAGRLLCEHLASAPIVNAAVGGAFASNLSAQAAAVDLLPQDRVVVSVGTNDAAPWKQEPLESVTRNVDEFLATVDVHWLVLLSSPGVDEARLGGEGDRTNATMSAYAGVIAARFRAAAGCVVDGRDVVRPLGSAAFDDDGVHLSGQGYDALLPALASALCGAADLRTHRGTGADG